MPRVTKQQLSLAQEFLRQFDRLERKACSEVEWLMLKLSCDEQRATELVRKARA